MHGPAHPRILATAEDAFLIEFASGIDPRLTPLIIAWQESLRQQLGLWLTDLVPSYGSITVYYDPDRVDFRRVASELRGISERFSQQFHESVSDRPGGRTIELPVWYHPSVGPDLEAVALAHDLTPAQVAHSHSTTRYQVYALGFSPGFAFMGQVSPDIATPRLTRPRLRVAAGSVGIADRQTAVYPSVSPGGWQLIGRCPTPLFDEEHLAVLQVGDEIRFRAVSREAFLALGGDDTPFEERASSS